MSTASKLLEMIGEMAAPYRASVPTGSIIFAQEQSARKFVLVKQGALWKIMVSYQNMSSEPPRPMSDFLNKWFGDAGIKTTGKGEKYLGKVRDFLTSKGYKEASDKSKLRSEAGKQKYATGEKEENAIENFKGVVYHGTDDIGFFSTTYERSDLGHGSHLTSLQGGDAFSVTPNLEWLKTSDFAGNMLIEYYANLTVYYASRGEDDLDEIDYPPECDAIAIPFGRYEEHEFAVIRMDGNNLRARAVYLPCNGVYKRFEVSETDINLYGEYQTFVRDWLLDVYGEEVVEAVDRYDSDAIRLAGGREEPMVSIQPDHSKSTDEFLVAFNPDDGIFLDEDGNRYSSEDEFLRALQ